MRFFLLLIICIVFVRCKDEYTRLVEREQSSGVRHDSLFLNLHLGMSRQAFIDTCWQLNRRGVVFHGTEALTLAHEMGSEFRHGASMNLYPDFTKNGLIWQVPIIFKYDDWEPWRKELVLDSLRDEVMSYFMRAYGGHPFQEFDLKKTGGKIWVKVDGNRLIHLFQHTDVEKMKAVIRDLSVGKNEIPPDDPSNSTPSR